MNNSPTICPTCGSYNISNNKCKDCGKVIQNETVDSSSENLTIKETREEMLLELKRLKNIFKK